MTHKKRKEKKTNILKSYNILLELESPEAMKGPRRKMQIIKKNQTILLVLVRKDLDRNRLEEISI
jgi:hypothetical protein